MAERPRERLGRVLECPRRPRSPSWSFQAVSPRIRMKRSRTIADTFSSTQA
jgi:hypothetical protein